jgi:hypothetical protein
MSFWKTSTQLYTEDKLTQMEETKTQCGMFHGDS